MLSAPAVHQSDRIACMQTGALVERMSFDFDQIFGPEATQEIVDSVSLPLA